MISRYQTESMKYLWSDEKKYETWFLVERAYLKAYLQWQGIDDGLSMRLEAKANAIDWHKFCHALKRYDDDIKHDVIAFLHALEDELKEDARLIHIGLTSSDVVDTAFALLLAQAGRRVQEQLLMVITILWQKANTYRRTACLGRTHGQPAEPITFGVKLLSHICELYRGYERLTSAIEAIKVGKLSGAVGVYAHTDPEVEALALNELGLQPETIATQVVARDRHAGFFTTFAILAGSVERLAVEIRLLMHGDVREVFEPFSAKQKGSSAMPHKKNPILSENLTGLMRMVRSYSLAALENQALWHERDISHSSVERIIAPDATSLMEFALVRLAKLIALLEVDEAQMAKNLDGASNKLASQSIMIELIKKGYPRQAAYELVQKAALNAEDKDFFVHLKSDGIEDIIGHDKFKKIMCDRHEVACVDELFERVGKLLATLGEINVAF